MRTKTDYTFMIFCFAVSLVFFIPFVLNRDLTDSKATVFFIFFGIILVLLGLWTCEYYVITDKYIRKYNFGGLYYRRYQLNKIISFQNKHINVESSDLNILSFFIKNADRYLIFNKLKFTLEGDSKLRIDERFIPADDFKNIKIRLKKEVNKNLKQKI